MVINGKPALACDTFLKEIPGEKITLEPLRKFPVVEDLVVDRSIMMENLKALSVWLNEDAQLHSEEMAFEASVCLQCGLCLEVCPNFAQGGSFGGMAAMNPLAHLIANSPREGRKAVAKSYRRGVFNGCGKSLACRNICPAGIRIEGLLVKSNAAAVWGRWGQIGKGSR
jgi:succinate dehydrogenase / fumarate reductase iron-sulfur subunit